MSQDSPTHTAGTQPALQASQSPACNRNNQWVHMVQIAQHLLQPSASVSIAISAKSVLDMY